jgi:hypothetical protein
MTFQWGLVSGCVFHVMWTVGVVKIYTEATVNEGSPSPVRSWHSNRVLIAVGFCPLACYVACWVSTGFLFLRENYGLLPGLPPTSPPSKWPSSCVIYDIQYRKRPAASGGLTYHGTELLSFALSQISTPGMDFVD